MGRAEAHARLPSVVRRLARCINGGPVGTTHHLDRVSDHCALSADPDVIFTSPRRGEVAALARREGVTAMQQLRRSACCTAVNPPRIASGDPTLPLQGRGGRTSAYPL